MIVAGLFAVAVILFSQSLYQQAELTQKDNTENKKASSEKVVISAPSDAVTSNSIVKFQEASTTQIQSSFVKEENNSILKVETRIFIKYFNILFRAIISPNAP